MDPDVSETLSPFAYAGDDPVDNVDPAVNNAPLRLCLHLKSVVAPNRAAALRKDLQRAYSQLNRYKPAGATLSKKRQDLAAARKDLPLIAAFVNCLPDGGEDLAAAALACLSQTAASNLFNTIAGDNAIGISLAIDPLGTLLGEFYSLGQGVANTAVSVAMALKGDSGKGIVTGVTYGAKWGFSCMWRTGSDQWVFLSENILANPPPSEANKGPSFVA